MLITWLALLTNIAEVPVVAQRPLRVRRMSWDGRAVVLSQALSLCEREKGVLHSVPRCRLLANDAV